MLLTVVRDINVAPTDLGEGRVQVVMASFAIVQPQMQAGRIRLIAVNNKTRAPAAPDIPTARESGYSSLEVEGAPVDVAEFMPLVLMNPKITAAGKPVSGPEGCLSFPEIFGEITRPDLVDVEALDKAGKMIQFRCGGLLARAVQHETDHLNGILFIDRMDKKTKDELRPDLEQLQAETKAALKK